MSKVQIELPPKLIPVFTGPARYRGAYGGRGSAKTRSFALMSAVRAYMFSEASISGCILCGREFMNSLDDSSMEEIKQAIRSVPWLNSYFDIGEKYIRTKNNRVRYVFAGLRNNLDSIKSKARVLLAWVDEGENVSEAAWNKLIPTVREEGSEIWVTWNPEKDGSPTDKRFRKNPAPNSKIVEMNWQDNPWFPEVLRVEKDYMYSVDVDSAAHVWGGGYKKNSAAQVLRNKCSVESFTPQQGWAGPYHGADWGFATDPTTLVKLWIHDGCLYVENEVYGLAVEIEDTPALFDKIEGAKQYAIRADSARPELISYMQRHGYGAMIAAQKWPGSVEDGITFLRSFKKIIIHPRCKHTEEESRLWSYKVDKYSGDVLPELVDRHNHCWDAIRYALEPITKNSGFGLLDFYKTQSEGQQQEETPANSLGLPPG